tara:strand:- start:2028 stop:2822 length:795 start_codon:yes stop_codon:yes gene_type:complete
MNKYIDKQFLKKYANWETTESIGLTFDIDWAPDFMISNIHKLLKKYNVKATLFITHNSKYLKELSKDPFFEIGLHPYLSENSTQGKDFNDILTNLKTLNKNSVGCRFHVLDYSYRDLLSLQKFGIHYDVSRIYFNTPFLLPTFHKDLNLVLLTYFWEDGVCENQNILPTIENIDLDSPGLKIINFHPMNVYINSSNVEQRKFFQKSNPNLLASSPESVNKFINRGKGSGTFLIEILEYIKINKIKTFTLGELVRDFPKKPYHVK